MSNRCFPKPVQPDVPIDGFTRFGLNTLRPIPCNPLHLRCRMSQKPIVISVSRIQIVFGNQDTKSLAGLGLGFFLLEQFQQGAKRSVISFIPMRFGFVIHRVAIRRRDSLRPIDADCFHVPLWCRFIRNIGSNRNQIGSNRIIPQIHSRIRNSIAESNSTSPCIRDVVQTNSL